MKKKIDMVLQFLLGAFLLTFGLNKFFHFMEMFEVTEEAGALFGAFMESGYILPMVGITEIVVGVLLILRAWSALALLLLAPLSVNIVLFHLVLDPGNIGPAAAVFILNLYLFFVYKPKYKPVLSPK